MFERAAAPALDFAGRIAAVAGPVDAAALLAEARRRLESFAEDVRQARMPPAAVAPARLALALVVDRAARENPEVAATAWGAGAHRLLFDGEEMSPSRLRDFAERAERAGPGYAELARFLTACLAWVEGARARREAEEVEEGWGGLLLAAVGGFLLLVAAWTVHAEWAFHRETAAAFAEEAVAIGLDRAGEVPDLAARLDRLAGATRRVELSLERAPVHLLAGPLGFDAGEAARATLAEAAARHLPAALARAADRALAQEGDAAALYDTLRAWEVVSGAAPWDAGRARGWLEDRREALPDLQGLAPHVTLLAATPAGPLPPPDAELLAQARSIAAEATDAERAWVELIRAPAMTALPAWRPDREVPGLADVALRRSGRPMSDPLPGRFTAAGWEAAQAAAAPAVAEARAQGRRMFGQVPAPDPATEAAILARLQEETLAAWNGFLGDLRVKPFDRRATGVLVSGLLARGDSPLARLLREAWEEAGGPDRSRPAELQLRVAAALGPTIQYVEGGGLDQVAGLFAALNAALGARGQSEELRTERLMGIGERADSLAALKVAPPVVARIVEDVLAQAAVRREERLSNPVTRDWQAGAFAACQGAVEGRFPFAAGGADADPAALAAFLGPGGALDRFLGGTAQAALDTAASPWRWRPEARFEGLTPEGAAALERARAIQAALFGGGAIGADMTVATLAARGSATISLGGASAAVDAAAGDAVLRWPGPDPAAGVSVAFAGGGTLSAPGPWGLLRLLDGLRLRERDGGRLVYVDLRGEGGRVFVALTFPSAANPVTALRLARGFVCPAAM